MKIYTKKVFDKYKFYVAMEIEHKGATLIKELTPYYDSKQYAERAMSNINCNRCGNYLGCNGRNNQTGYCERFTFHKLRWD